MISNIFDVLLLSDSSVESILIVFVPFEMFKIRAQRVGSFGVLRGILILKR